MKKIKNPASPCLAGRQAAGRHESGIRKKIDEYIIINSLDKDQNYVVKDNEEKVFFLQLLDGKNQQGRLTVSIKGKNSDVEIFGIIIGYGKQQISLSTVQDHLTGEGKSNLLIKSVLFDEARFSYQGLIKIEKDAQKSDAYQKNQNLLLSDKARVLTTPKLEILANDVCCTHGSTTGKIDKDQLFYLLSRGLDKKEATKLLLNGFFQEILIKVPDEGLKKELEEQIDRKMNELITKINIDTTFALLF